MDRRLKRKEKGPGRLEKAPALKQERIQRAISRGGGRGGLGRSSAMAASLPATA